ncbi:hypothetical protein HDU97_008248 [Phlyctochytrium planicorne]|nr:hypothetical protein HDU97_008248 [Phlyctochytrium planicorne]
MLASSGAIAIVRAQSSEQCDAFTLISLPFDLNGVGDLPGITNRYSDVPSSCECNRICASKPGCTNFVYKPNPNDGDYRRCYLKFPDKQGQGYRTIFLADTSIRIDGSFSTTSPLSGTYSESSCLDACRSRNCNYVTLSPSGECYAEPGSTVTGGRLGLFRANAPPNPDPVQSPNPEPASVSSTAELATSTESSATLKTETTESTTASNEQKPTSTSGSTVSSTGPTGAFATSTQESQNGSGSGSTVVYIGVGVGVVVLLAIAAVGIFLFMRRRRQQYPVELKSMPAKDTRSFYPLTQVHPSSMPSKPDLSAAQPPMNLNVAPPLYPPEKVQPTPVHASPNQNTFQGSQSLWDAGVQINEKSALPAAQWTAQNVPQYQQLQLQYNQADSNAPAWSEKQALAQSYGMQASSTSSHYASTAPTPAYQAPSSSVSAFPSAAAEKRSLANAPRQTPSSVPRDIAAWNRDDVYNGLLQAGAPPFAVTVLRDHNFTGTGLLALDLRSVSSLGFNGMVAQKVLDIVNALRAGQGATLTSTSDGPPQYF